MKIKAEFNSKPEAIVTLKEIIDVIETKTVTDFAEGLLLRFSHAIIAGIEEFEHEQIDSETYTPEPPPISEHRWPE